MFVEEVVDLFVGNDKQFYVYLIYILINAKFFIIRSVNGQLVIDINAELIFTFEIIYLYFISHKRSYK